MMSGDAAIVGIDASGHAGAPESPRHVHATSVAIGGRAVLLMGAPGAGKSDLALRLIDRGAWLIADDQTIVTRCEGAAGGDHGLVAGTPPCLAGLIEVRGVGIVTLPWITGIAIALVVMLDQSPERMPEAEYWACLGRRVPQMRCLAFEGSAPVKIEWALRRMTGGDPMSGAHSSLSPGEGALDDRA